MRRGGSEEEEQKQELQSLIICNILCASGGIVFLFVFGRRKEEENGRGLFEIRRCVASEGYVSRSCSHAAPKISPSSRRPIIIVMPPMATIPMRSIHRRIRLSMGR